MSSPEGGLVRIHKESPEELGHATVEYWRDTDNAAHYTEGAREDDNGLATWSTKMPQVIEDVRIGDVVIELGSGTGLAAQELLNALDQRQISVRLLGADVSVQMLDHNIARARYENVAVADLQQGLPSSMLGLSPRLIFSIGMLHYFSPEGMRKIISDIRSQLKTESSAAVTVSIYESDEASKDSHVLQPIQENGVEIGSVDTERFYHYYHKEWLERLFLENNLVATDSASYRISKSENKYPAILYILKPRELQNP